MKKSPKQLKHYFEYIIFIIFTKFLLLLGLEKATAFCSYIARKIGPHIGVSKIARRNISMTLGDENIEQIIDGLWDNYGRYIAEFAYVDKLPQNELDARINFEGLENIRPLIEKQQPFLLCLGHLANWDFLIKNINQLYPEFSIIYRKANNPLVDKAILATRQSKNVHMIAKGPSGAKKLLTAIKSRHSIAMLVDQKMNDGIEVPFFGKPAMTANAIAKFSMQYNYPIIPLRIIRMNGSNFKAIIQPAIEYEKTGNVEQDSYEIMLKINKILEEWIRLKPEQWFWFHNRWKISELASKMPKAKGATKSC